MEKVFWPKPIVFLPIDKRRNYIGAPQGDTEKPKGGLMPMWV